MVDKYYEYETYISYDVECRDSGVVCFLFAGHSFSDEFQAIMTMDSLCMSLQCIGIVSKSMKNY